MQVSRTAPPSRSGISVNDAGPETRNRTAPRERSRIEFPYLDLANALDVAVSIRSMPKAPCTLEALATKFKQQSGDATFRLRISSAVSYGLIVSRRKTLFLTDIGRITTSGDAKQARVDAFLRPPLFKRVYEHYHGGLLPGPAILENYLEKSGVTAKSRAVARQVFVRSATQAGLLSRDGFLASVQTAPLANVDTSRENSGPPSHFHPLIQGLLNELPAPGKQWDLERRKQWIATAEQIFAFVYKA